MLKRLLLLDNWEAAFIEAVKNEAEGCEDYDARVDAAFLRVLEERGTYLGEEDAEADPAD